MLLRTTVRTEVGSSLGELRATVPAEVSGFIRQLRAAVWAEVGGSVGELRVTVWAKLLFIGTLRGCLGALLFPIVYLLALLFYPPALFV